MFYTYNIASQRSIRPNNVTAFWPHAYRKLKRITYSRKFCS